MDFNPPAPCGAGRRASNIYFGRSNFNPPAPCGAGRRCSSSIRNSVVFHPPPLAGRDAHTSHRAQAPLYFNPPPFGAGRKLSGGKYGPVKFHPPAPCGTGLSCFPAHNRRGKFQSTRPLRAGLCSASLTCGLKDFNPPAPCGRDVRVIAGFRAISISIHPPRAVIDDARNISNPPPLAGRDDTASPCGNTSRYFNPPAPCGGGTFVFPSS